MPTASRNERKKRRIRRNLTLMTRLARQEQLDRTKVTTVLLSLLSQHGGEIEVTQETLNATIASLGKVQYVVEKRNPDSNPFDGIFVVKLVTVDLVRENEPAPAPKEEIHGDTDPAAEQAAISTKGEIVTDDCGPCAICGKQATGPRVQPANVFLCNSCLKDGVIP